MYSQDDLVSIGMPVFNGEQFIEDAINANLAQTHEEFELIISDNASTDGTESICREFEAIDERIRYVRNPTNIGAAENYNRLVSYGRGSYFRWSNADDLVDPKLLERTLAILRKRPDAVLAYGKTCLIDADGRSLGEYEDNLDIQSDKASIRYATFFKRIRLTNVIYGLMRMSAVRRTKLMGSGKLPAGDISFMAAMILHGKFVEVPEVLFFRRMHEGAFSANPDAEDELEFWSGTGGGVRMPYWRSELANIGAILSARLPISEYGPLLTYSIRRLVWQRKYLTRDIAGLFSRRPVDVDQ